MHDVAVQSSKFNVQGPKAVEPGFRSQNQKCRKRGGTLEQRRRPTVKFHSHVVLSYFVG